MIRGVPESLKNYALKSCLQAVCHIVAEDGSDEYPHLWIAEGLLDLCFLMVNVLDAGFVALETVDGD